MELFQTVKCLKSEFANEQIEIIVIHVKNCRRAYCKFSANSKIADCNKLLYYHEQNGTVDCIRVESKE